MPQRSEVTLSPHHYPPPLIQKGLESFPIKPTEQVQQPDGSTLLIFDCERPLMAHEFANHLITVKKSKS